MVVQTLKKGLVDDVIGRMADDRLQGVIRRLVMGIFVEFLVLRKLDAIIRSNQPVSYYAPPTRRERKERRDAQYAAELAAFQKRYELEQADPSLKVARLAKEKAEMQASRLKQSWENVYVLGILLGIFGVIGLISAIVDK